MPYFPRVYRAGLRPAFIHHHDHYFIHYIDFIIHSYDLLPAYYIISPTVLFDMIENILIDVSAAKKIIDSAERFICKDIINCIYKSKLLISNNNIRKRNIFSFKNSLNTSYHSSVKRLAVTRIYIDESDDENSNEKSDDLIFFNQLN